MPTQRVLISGASIAGPALAFWLRRSGYDVTVVEKASALRQGGQAVDFKGETHLAVLERMGLLEKIRQHQTVPMDTVFVDGNGRKLAIMPGEFTGGDVEIFRGDLAQILYEATADDCTYVFGDRVTDLVQTSGGVDVTFERGEQQTFDLVVGADGIHSTIRSLAFGPEEDFVTDQGYYYALVNTESTKRIRPMGSGRSAGMMYNEPGRAAMISSFTEPAFFIFAAQFLDYDRFDSEQQRRILAKTYTGAGWRVPDYLAEVLPTADIYLDSISRVDIDDYARGRVVLLGDAAYGNTLAGFGTGLAIVGAYILAGELSTARGDYRLAFRRYQELIRDCVRNAGKSSPGPFLAPRTRAGIRLRNWIFKYPFLARMMTRVGNSYATDSALPDYARLITEAEHTTET